VSGDKVDLSQIRGDWDFHARYVCNAMEQTLKRTNKYWKELKKASKRKGQVPVDGQLMEEFIEACMQTRAITDDFLMLAECQAPAGKKKSSGKQAESKTAKKSARKAPRKPGGKKRTFAGTLQSSHGARVKASSSAICHTTKKTGQRRCASCLTRHGTGRAVITTRMLSGMS
jgi:hypothetical protein